VRVLILVDCYFPSHKSGAKLIHDLGVELSRQGCRVTILTAAPGLARNLVVSDEDALRVARVKTPKIKGAWKPIRAFHEARLSSVVWRKAGQFLADNPADLILFYSPTIFWGGLVSRLKTLWQVPAYLILRDIFPEWAADVGLLGRGLTYRYFHRQAIRQYDAADVIGVQSPGDLPYFENRFERVFPHRPNRLEVLHNWSAVREQNLARTEYRVRLGLQGKVVFFYGGNLGAAQDVGNILGLASSLKDHDEIRFLLVGEGDEVPRLRKMISRRDLRNILLLPAMEQHEYLAMVSEFDVGLITLDRRLIHHNIPGRLLAYLYWGIPVLASINPGNDLFQLIGNSFAGFCLENGEDEKLRVAALVLAGDADLRARMGKNARALLERTFSAERAARQILQNFVPMAQPEDRAGMAPVRHVTHVK
jgi:glycosyltransferase involved in cell wall biosynthesis